MLWMLWIPDFSGMTVAGLNSKGPMQGIEFPVR